MVVLRCTQRLLGRLHVASPDEPGHSTTILGDWYANALIVDRRQFVMCTNELSKLTVIVPFKEASSLRERFRTAVGDLLQAINIPSPVLNRELAEMASINFARTQNRSLLGNMNDLALPAGDSIHGDPEVNLLSVAVYLSNYLVGPQPYVVPREVATKLLSGAA